MVNIQLSADDGRLIVDKKNKISSLELVMFISNSSITNN